MQINPGSPHISGNGNGVRRLNNQNPSEKSGYSSPLNSSFEKLSAGLSELSVIEKKHINEGIAKISRLSLSEQGSETKFNQPIAHGVYALQNENEKKIHALG